MSRKNYMIAIIKSPDVLIQMIVCLLSDHDPDGKAWCPTKVDHAGNHLHGAEHWGH